MCVYFRHRFQQLERESEELDQSFQVYLRRQQILKHQMNDDASKIWENYTMSKAALAQFDKIDDKHNAAAHHQPIADSIKVDYVLNSTFYDDVDIDEVLRDLKEIKRMDSPRFDINEAFPKNRLFKSQKNGFKSFNGKRDDHYIEKPKKVEVKLMSSEKLAQKQVVALEKPIKSVVEPQPIQIVVAEIAPEPKTPQKEKETEPKANAADAVNLHGTKLQMNGSTESKIVSNVVEPIVEKLIENGEDSTKMSDLKQTSSAVMNGHASGHKNSNDVVQTLSQQKDEKEHENDKMKFSPPQIKVNGVTPPTEKLDVIEKAPITSNGNGSIQKTSSVTTNGFAKKLTTFTAIASDSDSAGISEQISIGQQRIIKSPDDDFWI